MPCRVCSQGWLPTSRGASARQRVLSFLFRTRGQETSGSPGWWDAHPARRLQLGSAKGQRVLTLPRF